MSRSISVGALGMAYPARVVWDDPRFYVADALNHRVLVWNGFPTGSADGADFALGQPNLSSAVANSGGRSASTLDTPLGLAIGDGGRLYVLDWRSNRILWWDDPSTSGSENSVHALAGAPLKSYA